MGATWRRSPNDSAWAIGICGVRQVLVVHEPVRRNDGLHCQSSHAVFNVPADAEGDNHARRISRLNLPPNHVFDLEQSFIPPRVSAVKQRLEPCGPIEGPFRKLGTGGAHSEAKRHVVVFGPSFIAGRQ